MIPTVAVRRTFWRIVSPRWMADPLSGAGAARNGGRWNRPGQPALYLSEEIETAFAEYQQDLGFRPGAFTAFQVEASPIVDLTSPEARMELAVSDADLIAPWKRLALVEGRAPPGWGLADRLVATCAGVRVPSVQRTGGVNLVLWSWNGPGAPTVAVVDPAGELAANA